MSNSEQLRKNIEQHKSKNTKSKKDDKLIYNAMLDVKDYLVKRFSNFFNDKTFYITHEKKLSIGFMKDIIYKKGIRKITDDEENKIFDNRTIKPDGGVLLLKSHSNNDFCKVLLVSEVKSQGTNDKLKEEGKPKQSRGNAVERLGKNLTAIKSMFMHELITPFVCFGWGALLHFFRQLLSLKLFFKTKN